MKRRSSVLLGLHLLLVGSWVGESPTAQASWIVFGDGLCAPAIPQAPSWIEHVAHREGRDLRTWPVAGDPRRVRSYASPGARARPGATMRGTSLGGQVELFLRDFEGVVPEDARYVIWIGTNDARDALGAGNPRILDASVRAIATHIALLATEGARRFLIVNVPDLGLVPSITRLPDPMPARASDVSLAYNRALSEALDSVEPGVKALGGEIVRVDSFIILNDFVANPADYGFANVTESCLIMGTRGNFHRGVPSRFLFWDGIHRTAAGHQAFADAVQAILEE